MLARSLLVFSVAVASAAPASGRPSVASINLCTDQLLLNVAAPEQIATLSWLSADPKESMLAARARAYPLNYGSAEEILAFDPDVVIGGEYTSVFTRELLARLGYTVLTVAPANSVDDIARNLSTVAAAIGRDARGREVVSAMRARIAGLERAQPDRPLRGIVVRPGGFTVGAGTLADELMALAGIDNVAGRQGLDAWGSLSVESLLRSEPELLIFTGFRTDAPSLANALFAHPVLARLGAGTTATSLDATYWSCGAPQSLRSAELLATTTTRRLGATAPTGRPAAKDPAASE